MHLEARSSDKRSSRHDRREYEMIENGYAKAVRAALLVATWGASAACDGVYGSGTSGNVGNGTFDYECLTQSDAACSKTDAIDSFAASNDLVGRRGMPRAVAVGALFGLNFDPSGPVDNTYRVVAATSDDARSPGEFQVERPGHAAFIAVRSGEKASDYIGLDAREAVGLRVWSEQRPIESIELRTVDRVTLTVTPVDDDESLLAGALPLRWESLDESIVSLSRLGASRGRDTVSNEVDVILHAEGVGRTRVRVQSGRIGHEFSVEVRR